MVSAQLPEGLTNHSVTAEFRIMSDMAMLRKLSALLSNRRPPGTNSDRSPSRRSFRGEGHFGTLALIWPSTAKIVLVQMAKCPQIQRAQSS